MVRFDKLQQWLQVVLHRDKVQVDPVSGDASFRRYFRVSGGEKTFIVMDAPPEKESCDAFVAVAREFLAYGLTVPTIYAWDKEQGFLLLSDLGDTLYSHVLNVNTANELYDKAVQALLKIQACEISSGYVLPQYDEPLLMREMGLFHQWYLEAHLGVTLDKHAVNKLNEVYLLLASEALSQPTVCVHRDYHSRNLMVAPDDSVGILDFQDAVTGPITYDLVSLLRDCYVAWPDNQVQQWALAYQAAATACGLLPTTDQSTFLRWFDWMGVQRHLKCLGIFSRLAKRDNKSSYLKEIPRVLNYVKVICKRYSELSLLEPFLIDPAQRIKEELKGGDK